MLKMGFLGHVADCLRPALQRHDRDCINKQRRMWHQIRYIISVVKVQKFWISNCFVTTDQRELTNGSTVRMSTHAQNQT